MTMTMDSVITLLSVAVGVGVFIGQTKALRAALDQLTKAIETLTQAAHDHDLRLTRLETFHEFENERPDHF